jgi:hypothetical protein
MYNRRSQSLAPESPGGFDFDLFPKRKAPESARNSTEGRQTPHKIPRRDSQSPKIHTVTNLDDSSDSSDASDNNARIGAGANSGLGDDEEPEGK